MVAGVSVLAAAYQPLWTAGAVYEDRRWLAEAIVRPSVWPRPRSLALWAWWLAPGARAAHLLSLALHLLVSGLVGVLAWRLGLSRGAAWFAAGLLALHPLTSEAVGYLSARTELLAAVGVLGACLLATVAFRPWSWLAIASCLWLGVMGKESASVGFLLVPLVYWATGDRLIAEVTSYVAALGVAIGVILSGGWQLIADRGGSAVYADNGTTVLAIMDVSWWPWLLVQATAAMRLLGQAVLPLTLTVDYDYDVVALWVRYAALAGLVALAGLAWSQRSRRPLVTFGLAWTLLAILPRFIVQTPRGILNEHQFLTPLIGLVIAGAALWDEWRAYVEALTLRTPHE